MRPFSFPRLPNPNQTEGSNNSTPQQVVSSNSCGADSGVFSASSNLINQLPCSSCAYNNPLAPLNSLQIHSQVNVFNPHLPRPPFGNTNINFNNLNGNYMAMLGGQSIVPSPCFPTVANHYHPLQNVQTGMPILGPSGHHHLMQTHGQTFPNTTPQNFNPIFTPPAHGQFFHNLPQNSNQIMPSLSNDQLFMHNHPQVPSQIGPLQPHPSVNMQSGMTYPLNHVNPTIGMPNAQLYLQNQVGNASQHVALVNPSEAAVHNKQATHDFVTPNMGQNAFQESPIVAEKLQGNITPSAMQQPHQNLQHANFQQSQGSSVKNGGNNIAYRNPRNPRFQKFAGNHQNFGRRESSNPRFQKSQFHSTASSEGGNFRNFNRKGNRNDRGRKSNISYSPKQAEREDRRSLHLSYTEQEVLQWREERRKNYPSKVNLEMKLTEKRKNPELIATDAKRRCQQLKEILAKQAELGVEVAEIPSNYLSKFDTQVGGREEDKKVIIKSRRSRNKYGKRGKCLKDSSSTMPASVKRQPTLLQKLLSAEIKREKSYLLQAFRFMLLNSFFKDGPEKPLVFPSVTVRDTRTEGQAFENYLGQGNNGVSKVLEKVDVEETGGPKHYNSVYDDGGKNDSDQSDPETETFGEYVGEADHAMLQDIAKSEPEEGEIID